MEHKKPNKKKRTFLICGMLKEEFTMLYDFYTNCFSQKQEKDEIESSSFKIERDMNISWQLKQIKYEDKLVFFPRSLHKNPIFLHQKLQNAIDKEEEADEILLLYGFCGRATEGLYSKNAKLLLPKFDDCIQLLCYESNRTTRSIVKKDHLYVTKGWCQDEESILNTCRKTKEMYPREAKDILDAIYGGYKTITILDTKAYEIEQVKENVQECCSYLNMKMETKESSLKVIKNLILGLYKDEIILKEPQNQVSEKDYE